MRTGPDGKPPRCAGAHRTHRARRPIQGVAGATHRGPRTRGTPSEPSRRLGGSEEPELLCGRTRLNANPARRMAGSPYFQRPASASSGPVDALAGSPYVQRPPARQACLLTPLDAPCEPTKSMGPIHVHCGVPTFSGPARGSIGSPEADPRQALPAECAESPHLHSPFRPPDGLDRRASSPRRSPSRSACCCRAPRRLEPTTHARWRIRAATSDRARRSTTASPARIGAQRPVARSDVRPRTCIRRSPDPPRALARARAMTPRQIP